MSLITTILMQVLGIVIGKLLEWLYALAEQAARFDKIDARLKPIVEHAVQTRQVLKAVETNPDASEEEKAKAYEAFKRARSQFRVAGLQ